MRDPPRSVDSYLAEAPVRFKQRHGRASPSAKLPGQTRAAMLRPRSPGRPPRGGEVRVMPGLESKLMPVDGDDLARIAELSGAIDGNTVPDFQQMLEKVKTEGVRRLILDMSKIKYVNSTGLGSLVKYADSFKNSGGGMALIK